MAKDQFLCPDPDCTSRFTTTRGLVAHMTKQHDHDQLSGSSDSASEGDVPPITGARAATVPPAKRPVTIGRKANRERFEAMGGKRPIKAITKDKRSHKMASAPGRKAPIPTPVRRRRTPTPPPKRRKSFRSIAMGQFGETAGSSSAVSIDLRTPSLVSDTESTSDSACSDEDESGSDAFGLCGGSAAPAKKVDIPKIPTEQRTTSASTVTLTNATDRTALNPIPADQSKSAGSTTTVTQPSTSLPSISTSSVKKKPFWVVRTPSPIPLVDRRPIVNTIGQSASPQSAESDADDDGSESESGSEGSSSELDEVSAELDNHSAGSLRKSFTSGSYRNPSLSKANPTAVTQAANQTPANNIIIPLTTARQPTGSSKTAVSSSEDEAPVTPSKPPVKAVARKSPPAPSFNRSIPRTPNALEAFRIGALDEPAGSFLGPLSGQIRHKLSGATTIAKEPLLSVKPGIAEKCLQGPSVPNKTSSVRPPPLTASIGSAVKRIETPAVATTDLPDTTLQAAQHTGHPIVPDLLAGNTHRILGAIARFLLDLSEIGGDTDRPLTSDASSGMHAPISEAGSRGGTGRGRKRARGDGDQEEEARSQRFNRLTEDLRGVTGL